MTNEQKPDAGKIADAVLAKSKEHLIGSATISEHDLSTSTGGRGYMVEYFAKRLRRHDFQRYIEERLAADFACVLAQYLSERDAASPAAPAQSGEAVAYIDGRTLRGFANPQNGHDHLPVSIRRGNAILESDVPLYTVPQPAQSAVVLDDERAAFVAMIDSHKAHDGSIDSFELADSIIAHSAQATATPPASVRVI